MYLCHKHSTVYCINYISLPKHLIASIPPAVVWNLILTYKCDGYGFYLLEKYFTFLQYKYTTYVSSIE